jgi:uncharacterized membrane protein YeaQ/YmgE (transglycosylase-associated protein family)
MESASMMFASRTELLSHQGVHAMEGLELPEKIQHLLNDVLVWIGFGTLAGLLAKAIMPGRDPGGAMATLLMGIGGSVIGSGMLSYFANIRVSPISPIGFVTATAGAFVLLFFYRLLAGRTSIDDGGRVRDPYYRRFSFGRRRSTARDRIID